MPTENNVAAQAGDCDLRLCCKNDVHAPSCTTYDPARKQDEIAAQGGDEPMRAAFEAWLIAEAQRQHPVEPLTDKEKAFVLRRNVWDKTSYEAHDGAWQGWKAAHATQVSPRATADANLAEAVGKLIKAKGRFHTEQNYVAMVAAYDALPKK